MSFEEMEFFEKARYEIEGFYEPSQRARDDGVMELSTRNGFCSKADVEEKSFGIQMSYSYSTKLISWITFPSYDRPNSCSSVKRGEIF